jgi:hypothetical protein
MLRTVSGIIAGVLLAFAVLIGLEMAGHAAMPPPTGLDPGDPEDLKQMVASAPLAAKAWVVFGWFVATLAGGWLARRLSGKGWAGWVIAGLILLGGIANIMMIPHPLWMQVAAVAAPLLAGVIVMRLPYGGSAAAAAG